MTDLATQDDRELITTLQNSLYPGASVDSVKLVLGYCKQAGLDPIQKPVHIVPMWNSKARQTMDVVMPGIGLYRTIAARSGQYGGISEPEFGPDITKNIGGVEITYPQSCKVTAKRIVNNQIVEFSAIERWTENYALKGGKEKLIAPNAMWARRPYAQLAKCAEAQALRKAFPEVGAAPTAEEMEGKETIERDITPAVPAEDVSEYVTAISLCETMNQLQGVFSGAYKELKSKESIKAITDAKDDKKKELINAEVVE